MQKNKLKILVLLHLLPSIVNCRSQDGLLKKLSEGVVES